MMPERDPLADPLRLAAELMECGFAVLPQWLGLQACTQIIDDYNDAAPYRKTVVMERHGYGRGEYRYFAAPLPAPIAMLRRNLYTALVPAANRWATMMRVEEPFPATLDAMLERCHRSGQTRPTPLVLRYRSGDFNALHQDVYGEVAFPFQATVLLSEPGTDFTGGEFLLVETRARRQSVARVVPLQRGDAVVFANARKPNERGGRSSFRHGVSVVTSGERYTLGLILHDAR